MDSLKNIKDTLLLPKTDFPLRNSNYLDKEKKFIELWEQKRIYYQLIENNKNKTTFILHSGPPYANGKLHIGHFLNFIIKDVVVRYWVSQGFHAHFLLGWDAHGLPTEHKVLQTYKNQKLDLRPTCHKFALEQVQIQKEQLKKIGLFTDYDKHYITLDKKYEAKQLRIFGEMVKKNLIYQGFRPIHWSCGHETALAEAEIEYLEKKDISLYFKINLITDSGFLPQKNVNLIVWTTQPWTIPANRLVAVKKLASYALISYNDEYLITLESKIPTLKKWWEKELKIERVFLGESLLGMNYSHPYDKNVKGYIVDGSDFIEEKEGTGIVHLAPAFGAEDFATAKKERLNIECPLEPNGLFNEKIGVLELVNKHYSEVSQYVVNDLEKRNLIVKKEIITHSYPHDWRDKSPLIYRLTKQWFINIQALKSNLLKNIEEVKWYPSWTEEKMRYSISNRDDWCISRQRKWGVPLPILYDNDKPIINCEIIDYVAEIFEKNGSDCWFNKSILSILQKRFPNLITTNTILGEDIMDVWLDSGISHQMMNFYNKN